MCVQIFVCGGESAVKKGGYGVFEELRKIRMLEKKSKHLFLKKWKILSTIMFDKFHFNSIQVSL